MHNIGRLIYSLILLLFLSPCFGSIQEMTLPSGLVVTADYRQGAEDKPTIVVLHGFLSTRNFLTVSSLIDSLAEDGYSVLAPNLSLGVNKRNKTLPCEAIHTHSIDQDIEELDTWVKWLSKFKQKGIVLVGHSYGSLHVLLYTLRHPSSEIKKVIAASLVDVEHVIGREKNRSQINLAKSLIETHDNKLHSFQVSYCKKYVAPASAFLSYATWSQENILHAIGKLKTPLEIILGEKDRRMDKQWPSKLRKIGVNLQLIKGANHFFHNEQEFDLLDGVRNSLKGF